MDAAQAREPTTFIIDETFGVPGVGTVVAGTLKGGVITTGASLLLGPDLADGSFKPTAIKSIAYKRLAVNKVCARPVASAACLLCCTGAGAQCWHPSRTAHRQGRNAGGGRADGGAGAEEGQARGRAQRHGAGGRQPAAAGQLLKGSSAAVLLENAVAMLVKL